MDTERSHRYRIKNKNGDGMETRSLYTREEIVAFVTPQKFRLALRFDITRDLESIEEMD